MMDKSLNREVPAGAVTGLSDVLLALGEELRKANYKVGEYSYDDGSGEQAKQPVLFFSGATVELAVNASVSATGGVKVWVVNTEGGGNYERSGKITVHLNTDGQPFEVGQ